MSYLNKISTALFGDMLIDIHRGKESVPCISIHLIVFWETIFYYKIKQIVQTTLIINLFVLVLVKEIFINKKNMHRCLEEKERCQKLLKNLMDRLDHTGIMK